MMRMVFSVACIATILVEGVTCSAGEPLAEAKARIARCIEKEGEEYIEARNWLVNHPESLGLLGEESWRERWVKKICRGWIDNKDLYEREMKTFEIGEMHARGSVTVVVPDSFHWAKGASRTHGDRDVPLTVECLWKTGRHWRRYKAWRVLAVVEYLKLVGDPSVLDPAMEVLVSQSWDVQETPDPGSRYPRMDPWMRAFADLIDQMAPYRPVELILTFGNENTLAKLQSLKDSTETPEASKRVLGRTIKLLARRLEAKKQGLPVEEIGLFDLYAEFGDRTTLENMRTFWGKGRGFHGERVRKAMADLEKRLEEEEKPAEPE